MKDTTRSKIINQTSLVGIIVNVLLAAVKGVIGFVTGSIAVTLDGVNNLSDAGSSVITIISTKLAAKPADKEHPYGYGRIEYLSTLVISMIILYAGITSLSESIQKIIDGQTPDYSTLSLWLLALAVVAKILLGLYTIRKGKQAQSSSLEASGKDALNDSILSAAVLASALIFNFWGVNLEAWTGLVISIFIIKSGLDITKEALSSILGERSDPELSHQVRETIEEIPGIEGAYDLFFHDYGPNRKIASVHIQVPDTWHATEIDRVSREIEQQVYMKYGVLMSAIGVYAANNSSPQEKAMEQKVRAILNNYPHILQMHGFYIDEKLKELRFDIIISFDEKDRHSEYEAIQKEVQKAFPDYKVQITLDSDIAD